MKVRNELIWLSIPLLVMALAAHADDPKARVKGTLQVDCEALAHEDFSTIDLMELRAMWRQCLQQAQAERESGKKAVAQQPRDHKQDQQ
jgi:hypothetical protein